MKTAERSPELRKLSLDSFLASPTTRLGRYLLLLKPSLEKAPENHPDRILVPQAIASIRNILSNLNREAGKSDNKLKLSQIEKKLLSGDGEKEELKLLDDERNLVREGKLLLRKTTSEQEVNIYLFDHMLLIARAKDTTIKVVRRPIPLELLVAKIDKSAIKAEVVPGRAQSFGAVNQNKTGKPLVKATSVSLPLPEQAKTYPIIFTHLGKYGGSIVLHATSEANRTSWLRAIETQKQKLTQVKSRFQIVPLSTFFLCNNKVNCSAWYQGKLVLGTDNGLYICRNDVENVTFVKVIDIERVSQVDLLLNNDMLLVLAGLVILT